MDVAKEVMIDLIQNPMIDRFGGGPGYMDQEYQVMIPF